MPIGPAIVGAGALLAWALSKKKQSQYVPPTGGGGGGGQTGPAQPTTQPNNTATDVVKGVAGAVGTVVTLVTSIAKGVGGAVGTASAKAGAIAAEGSSEAIAGSIDVVDAIGGSLFVAGILIAIIADQVTQAIKAASAPAMDLVLNSRGSDLQNAQEIFDAFTTKLTTAISATRQQYAMPTVLLRKVARTAIYLSYVRSETFNNGLLNFYRWFGWLPDSTGAIRPSGNAYANYGSMLWAYTDFWGQYFSKQMVTLSTEVAWRVDPYTVNKAYLTTPAGSLAELKADAIDLLGAKFWAVYNSVAFLGGAAAAAVMGTAGWFAAGTWPGDSVFAQTIAARLGWQATQASFWVTNQPGAPFSYTDWWLVDAGSGLRLAPSAIRSPGTIYISTPGAQVSPGVFSGGRAVGRFAGFGECAMPDGSAIVDCGDPRYIAAVQAQAARRAVTNRKNSRLWVPKAGSGFGLPIAIAAAGAFLLFSKSPGRAPGRSAPALSGYSRRRRRR